MGEFTVLVTSEDLEVLCEFIRAFFGGLSHEEGVRLGGFCLKAHELVVRSIVKDGELKGLEFGSVGRALVAKLQHERGCGAHFSGAKKRCCGCAAKEVFCGKRGGEDQPDVVKFDDIKVGACDAKCGLFCEHVGAEHVGVLDPVFKGHACVVECGRIVICGGAHGFVLSYE